VQERDQDLQKANMVKIFHELAAEQPQIVQEIKRAQEYESIYKAMKKIHSSIKEEDIKFECQSLCLIVMNLYIISSSQVRQVASLEMNLQLGRLSKKE
jgi:hypothetical protein